MAHSQIELKTSFGDTIYGNCWLVDGKKIAPKANIIISHGMAEYSYRYNDFAEYLNSLGYNVYAVDQPGHGLNVTATDKPKLGLGVWPNNGFKLAINYLHELILNVRLNMLPTILFGHSMGSFVSQRYYQRYSGTLDGLILSGSSANNATFVLSRRVAKILNKTSYKNRKKEPCKFFASNQTKKYNRKFKVFPDGYKSHNGWLSANEANVVAYDKDPYCGFDCSFNLYFNLFSGLKPTFQLKRVKEVTNPVSILLVAGKDDPVGSYGKGVLKLKKFYEKAGQKVECVLFDGMRHEILNEVDAKDIVYPQIANHIKVCINEHYQRLASEKHTVKKDVVENK